MVALRAIIVVCGAYLACIETALFIVGSKMFHENLGEK